MDGTVEPVSDELVSSAPDLSSVSLASLIDDAGTHQGVVDGVLDLEERGLLTVSSFNASI